MSNKQKLILGLLFFITVLLIYFSGIYKQFTIEKLQQHANQLKQFVENRYWVGIGLYILLFIGATVLTIPITIILTIASGFLFGILLGSIVTIFSATTGAVLLFCLVRFLIGEWIQERYKTQLQHFNKEIETYGPRYLLALQFLPITPTFLINTLAGVSQISLWNFIWTTAVGILPGTVLYAWIGYQLLFVQTVNQAILTGLMVILAVIALLILAPLVFRFFK